MGEPADRPPEAGTEETPERFGARAGPWLAERGVDRAPAVHERPACFYARQRELSLFTQRLREETDTGRPPGARFPAPPSAPPPAPSRCSAGSA